MPRANIDLSWLLGLMTQAPSATANPDYSASDETPYTDPVTGQTSGVMGQQRFTRPTLAQRYAYPEQSATIDRLNANFAAAPYEAEQSNTIRNAIGKGNFHLVRDKMPSQFNNPDITDEQGFLLSGGDYQPTHIASEAQALSSNAADLPTTRSGIEVGNARAALARLPKQNQLEDVQLGNTLREATDITPAKQNIEEAQLEGGVERAKTANTILSEQQKNDLQKITGVDRQTLELNEKELAGQLGRLPKAEELREFTLANSVDQQKAIHTAMPYTSKALLNNAIGNAYESSQLPVGAPIVNRIDADTGNINPLQKNPTGMSQIALEMAGLDDLKSMTGGGGVEKVTLPSGQSVGIRTNTSNSRKPINVLGTPTSTTVNSAIEASNAPNTSNQVAPDATPDISILPVTPIDHDIFMKQLGNVTDQPGYPASTFRQKAADSIMQSVGKAFGLKGSTSSIKSQLEKIAADNNTTLEEIVNNLFSKQEESNVYRKALGAAGVNY